MSAIAALTCDNETDRRGAGNASTVLTHLSDLGGRGLGVSLPSERPNAQPCAIHGCRGRHVARGLCTKHYQRAKKAGEFTPAPRCASLSEYLRQYAVLTGNCWEWTGKRSREGYGNGSWEGRTILTHRESYRVHVGPIPEGFQIDHLCRNRSCLRPDHLEAVPPRVNYLRGISPTARNKRKTHCKRGHEFTPENTRPVRTKYGHVGRCCRTCSNAAHRRYRQEARSA